MGPEPSSPLVALVRTESSAELAPVVARVEAFILLAKAANTWRGYRSDWAAFTAWCAANRRSALPADAGTVAEYLADNADLLKVATLQRRLAVISKAHRAAGLPSPASMSHVIVKETWKGIRRAKGIAQDAK